MFIATTAKKATSLFAIMHIKRPKLCLLKGYGHTPLKNNEKNGATCYILKCFQVNRWRLLYNRDANDYFITVEVLTIIVCRRGADGYFIIVEGLAIIL